MNQNTNDRIIRLPVVMKMTGLKKSSIYNMVKDKNSNFPPIIKIGIRSSGWSYLAVQKWVDDKINQVEVAA